MRSELSRIRLLVLVMVLLFGVVAPAAMAQDEEPIQIAFVTHVRGNPFIQQIIEGAQAAADDLGVELVTGGPEAFDADAQLRLIQDFVAAGADGVATSIAGESMANGLNELIDSGIPVVQFNLLSTSVNAPYVGERSTESGRILGNAVLEQLGGESATGTVIIGVCVQGFPVLENRGRGVAEALSAAPGLEVLGPFDVGVDPVDNYSRWEQQLAANPDAVALIGLCAPDVESLGRLKEASGADFVAGGYDLTEGNLNAVQEGNAFVTLGQSAFVQGYLPVALLVHSIRTGEPLAPAFYDSGTQVVTADSVDMANGLPALAFDDLIALSTDPAGTAEYYTPWTECVTGPGWKCSAEPIENEGA